MPSTFSLLSAVLLLVCLADIEASSGYGGILDLMRSPNRAKRAAMGEGPSCQDCLVMFQWFTTTRNSDSEFLSACAKDDTLTVEICQNFLGSMRETASNGVSAKDYCRIVMVEENVRC